MCSPVAGFEPKAEHKLASLMEQEMGTPINAQTLRLFIKAFWPQVSRWAHAIHNDGDDPSPALRRGETG